MTRPPNGNARDGDGDDHRGETGADGHGDGHREDEVGERLEHLHHALAHQIEAAAEIAARHAPERAHRGAEQHGRERDEERGARAVDHARERVAPHLVGAEERLGVGRLVHPAEVGLERVARGDPRGGQRDQDDEQRHDAARQRQRVAPREDQELAEARAPVLTGPDPRVEPRVGQVDEDVDGDEDQRVQEHQVLHHDDVALHDRGHEGASEAGHAERLLDGHRAAEHEAEEHAGDRDDGEERIGQRVVQHHRALHGALGARRPHVVLADHLEQARARHAGDVGALGQPQHDGRAR